MIVSKRGQRGQRAGLLSSWLAVPSLEGSGRLQSYLILKFVSISTIIEFLRLKKGVVLQEKPLKELISQFAWYENGI